MKKILSIIISLMIFTIFTGCDLLSNKGPELVYKELSERERTLLRITGNRVTLYEIENIPTNLGYELTISYELYEKGEKVKEEVITGVATENMEKDQKVSIAINFQEDLINSIISTDGLESGSQSAKVDVDKLNYTFLNKNTKLNFGEEIYIYQGSKGDTFSSVPLGTQIDEKLIEDTIKDKEYDVFIKLSLDYR